MGILGIIAIGCLFIPLSRKIYAWVRYSEYLNIQYPVQAFIVAGGFWGIAVWCVALGPIATRILAVIICYIIWSTIDNWKTRSGS